MITLSPLSKVFTDKAGTQSLNYKANAGDLVSFECEIKESIYFATTANRAVNVQNGFTTTKKFYFPDYESLNGFAVGQNVFLKVYRTPVQTSTTTITEIDYEELSLTVASLGTITNPSGLIFSNTQQLEIYSTDMRTQLFMNLNLVQSSLAPLNNSIASTSQGGYISTVAPYRQSSIDGSEVRFNIANTDTIIVTGTATGTQQGFKSGAYACSINIERLGDVNSYTRTWKLTISNIQIGSFLDSLFANAQYLNYYFDIEWYSETDLENPTVVQWNIAPSDTGLYNVGFRTEQPESTLTVGITNDVFFNENSTHEIEIDSTSADIFLGACYIPQDQDYYKLNFNNQSSLGMLLDSVALSATTYTSESNPTNADYDITINSLSYALGTHVVNFTITPNFNTFFNNRENDRLFRIWFKVGNTNVLVYNDQLKKAPKAIKPWDDIAPSSTFAIFRTDKQNVTYPATGASLDGGAYVSTEDNILLEINAQLGQSDIYSKSKFEVICVNTSDDTDYFVLEQYLFDWTSVQRDTANIVNPVFGQGIVLIDAELGISENLPATSTILSKATVEYRTADLTTFTVRMRCPLVLNWRYWLEQANAFVSFYPNQNKNYLNYQSSPYVIALRTSVENENEIYQHDAPIDAYYDYDEVFSNVNEEWAGTTEIQYFDENGTEQAYLLPSQIMRVLFTVNNTITATDVQTWGQLTIEPTESSPRWLISSNYASDTDVNNPWQPLQGETRLLKTIVSGTQVTFEALIDTDKLTGTNQKITGKYFNNASPKKEQVRSKFDTKVVTQQVFPDGNDLDCCDKIFNVFALTGGESYQNDVTSAWYVLNDGTVDFNLYKSDGETLATVQPQVFDFANQSNAKYCVIDWLAVFESDGIGCYYLKVEHTGFIDEVIEWGTYQLNEWTTDNVEGYVQIRAQFASNQTIEGIDFTNSKVIDCLNVRGFFGDRDPRTEIDNVIYNTRLDVKVTRENINLYTLTTDAVSRIFTRKLLDLYLLSENNLFITDNNSFNHESYIMKRVIVEEVPTPEYFQYSKKAKIIAKFGDKIKNQRSFY
jgi:hypothetical protein